MMAAAQIALALASVAVLLGVMALVRQLAARWHLSAEVQRKLVHIATGLYALILPWLFWDRWPVYMLIALTLVVMAALRHPRLQARLGQALHGVERRSYGDFLLALAVGLCFFFAEGRPLLYVLPLAVLTLADAAAALAGTTYGTRRFQVEDGYKSLEGTAVFFVVTLLIAMIALMFLSDLPPARLLVLALMLAAFGTLVEAQSWRGFDNLFLPLGLLVFLAVHLNSSLPQLAGLAGVFLLALVGFLGVGPRLGLGAHAARVHVVAMFLILAVAEAQNAVLPGLVLLIHAWASLRAPSSDAHGHLDVVAALGLLGFGWLALGNALGWNALSFYALSSMGLAMGLATVALGRGGLIWVAAVALGLMAVRKAVVMLNPAPTRWAEPLDLWALACLALPVAVVLWAPARFARDRVMKLALLTLALPLALYLAAVAGQGGFWERIANG